MSGAKSCPFRQQLPEEGKMRGTGKVSNQTKASSENLSCRIFGRGFFYIPISKGDFVIININNFAKYV
jgi:hypothetical protein